MYPLNLNLKGRAVLVVGGGAVAERKVRGLLAAGADDVRVVSPECAPKLLELAKAGRIRLSRRPFREEDASGCLLVFAATNAPETQRQIRDAARSAGAIVNIADAPEDCDFQVPATLRQGDIVITAATSGASPALAAFIRDELARHIGPEYATLARLLALVRAETADLSGPEKQRIFRALLDHDLIRRLTTEPPESAANHIRAILAPHLSPERLERLDAPIRSLLSSTETTP